MSNGLKTVAGGSALMVPPTELAAKQVLSAGPQGKVCMGRLLGATLTAGLLALASCWLAVPARAQTITVLGWQCSSTSASGATVVGNCPVSAAYPLPVSQGISALTPVAGTQVGTAIASATGLTIPTGATVALVQAQGTNTAGGICLFWRDDGSDPSGTAGQALAANATVVVKASSAFKAFAATGATCTMTASYYK